MPPTAWSIRGSIRGVGGPISHRLGPLAAVAGLRRTSTGAASAALLAIGGLHVLWATSSRWPLPDRDRFADTITGRPAGKAPGPGACLAVAGLLGTGAALVAGHPRRAPGLSRAGSAGVVAVLAARGSLGLAGRTDLLAPGSSSERFRELDRRIYAPLCLTLAALAAPAAARPVRTAPSM